MLVDCHAAYLHHVCEGGIVNCVVPAGECFCLLGPNGAGKSTTINCLTGVLPATAGEAIVHGCSITHQGGLNRVRGVMGVCPQFDVLWDNLTGREHLLLFGAIKGLTKLQASREADALLDQVHNRPQARACHTYCHWCFLVAKMSGGSQF